jgi:Fe-S-cluster containining protein
MAKLMRNNIYMKSLDLIKAENSGCQSFDRNKFKDYHQICIEEDKKYRQQYSSAFRSFLQLLVFEKFEEFELKIQERPDLLAEKEIKALQSFVLLLTDKPLGANHFFSKFTSDFTKKRLSQGMSKATVNMFSLLKNINFSEKIQKKLESLNLFSLKELIPDIVFYYAEYILKENIEESFDLTEQELLNFKFIDFCNGIENIEERQNAEKVRLLAFFYRKKKNEALAEKYMLEYRKAMPADIVSTLPPEIRTVKNTRTFPSKLVLENWNEILNDCDEAQDKVIEYTGIYKDTCGYHNCADCCNYTSPHMSLTEYKFMLNWIKENDYPIDGVIKKAKAIQEEHKKLFGEALPIIDTTITENKEKGLENPFNYKYSCPFLVEGRCSIYHARPLLCRGFGLSSADAVAVKTCNFYLNQYTHNCSRDNDRYVYDLRPVQGMAKASDRKLSQEMFNQEQELKGTIVAWLSSDQL